MFGQYQPVGAGDLDLRPLECADDRLEHRAALAHQNQHFTRPRAIRDPALYRARELGSKGIRANAICPGFIETPILDSIPDKVLRSIEERVPMGRLGTPEEIANTYAWLASDEASYINGAVIEVSGGVTI